MKKNLKFNPNDLVKWDGGVQLPFGIVEYLTPQVVKVVKKPTGGHDYKIMLESGSVFYVDEEQLSPLNINKEVNNER